MMAMTEKQKRTAAEFFEQLGDKEGVALLAALTAGISIGRRENSDKQLKQ